jgi:hypothetical protein
LELLWRVPHGSNNRRTCTGSKLVVRCKRHLLSKVDGCEVYYCCRGECSFRRPRSTNWTAGAGLPRGSTSRLRHYRLAVPLRWIVSNTSSIRVRGKPHRQDRNRPGYCATGFRGNHTRLRRSNSRQRFGNTILNYRPELGVLSPDPVRLRPRPSRWARATSFSVETILTAFMRRAVTPLRGRSPSMARPSSAATRPSPMGARRPAIPIARRSPARRP